jgi:hypothetical protein
MRRSSVAIATGARNKGLGEGLKGRILCGATARALKNHNKRRLV